MNKHKINFFEHKGLPIAALSLVFLMFFLLVAFYATQQTQIYDSSAAPRTQNVKKLPSATTSETKSVDDLIKDIDNFLGSTDDLSSTDLSDVEY